MKLRIVRNSEGQIIATSEAEERLSEVSIEPALEEGQQVEVVEVRRTDLMDVEKFYRSFGKGNKSQS